MHFIRRTASYFAAATLSCVALAGSAFANNGLRQDDLSTSPEVAIVARGDKGAYTLGLLYAPTQCSGVLIGPRHVLTSASCVTDLQWSDGTMAAVPDLEVYIQLGSRAEPVGAIAAQLGRDFLPYLRRQAGWFRASRVILSPDFAVPLPPLDVRHLNNINYDVAVLVLPVDARAYRPVRPLATRPLVVGEKFWLPSYGVMGADQTGDGQADTREDYREFPRKRNNGLLRVGTNTVDSIDESGLLKFQGAGWPSTETDYAPARDVSPADGDVGAPLVNAQGHVAAILTPLATGAVDSSGRLWVTGYAQDLSDGPVRRFIERALLSN